MGLSPITKFDHVAFQRLRVPPRKQTPVYNATLFAIVAHLQHLEQLSAVLHSWARDVWCHIYFEKARDSVPVEAGLVAQAKTMVSRFPNATAIFPEGPRTTTERSFSGAWKYLHIMRSIVEHGLSERLEYLVIVTQDTFIINRNVQVFLEWHRNDGIPLFTGGAVYANDRTIFPHGGGGIVLSRSALLAVKQHVLNPNDACNKFDDRWGDVRLTRCMYASGLIFMNTPAFSWGDIHYALASKIVALRQLFPLSFHRCSRPWVFELQALEMREPRSISPPRVLDWYALQKRYMELFSADVMYRSSVVQQGAADVLTFTPQQLPMPYVERRITWDQLYRSIRGVPPQNITLIGGE